MIKNFQAWKSAYDAKVDAFIAGPFAKSRVDQKLDQWSAQLRAAGYPTENATVGELKAILDRARTNRGFAY